MDIQQIDNDMQRLDDLETSKTLRRRERVMSSRSYKIMARVARWMDRYYIDPLLGLVPGGWGDAISAFMVLPFIWFSMFVVRSLPLTLAVIYNALRDVVMGLIPFFVGDIIDAFNRSYVRNMRLVQGFIDDDREIVREVRRKSWYFAIAIIVFIAVIVLLVKLSVYLIGKLFS